MSSSPYFELSEQMSLSQEVLGEELIFLTKVGVGGHSSFSILVEADPSLTIFKSIPANKRLHCSIADEGTPPYL